MNLVLTGSANTWSWHQRALHLAHLWPSGFIQRSECLSAENLHSALPDTSIPFSRLSGRTKTVTHSDARNPLTPRDCNNLFSSVHSSIPNTFRQKQIYGNPPVAFPSLLSNPHECSQTCLFSPFCIRKYGSTTALCSVIITSSSLSFTYLNSPI